MVNQTRFASADGSLGEYKDINNIETRCLPELRNTRAAWHAHGFRNAAMAALREHKGARLASSQQTSAPKQ